jgi:hypothetical protein
LFLFVSDDDHAASIASVASIRFSLKRSSDMAETERALSAIAALNSHARPIDKSIRGGCLSVLLFVFFAGLILRKRVNCTKDGVGANSYASLKSTAQPGES